MKVLFLDVDGVLNSDEDIISINNRMPLGDFHLSLLKEIVDNTNCSIVLSSSWRLNIEAKNKLINVLGKMDISIIDSTSNLGQYPRCNEIKNWLDRNKVDNFVILDDDEHAGWGFENNFVRTDSEFGLTGEDVELVINKFNSV